MMDSLRQISVKNVQSIANDGNEEKRAWIEHFRPHGFRHDTKEISRVSLPYGISYVLEVFLMPFVSQIFISRLGQDEFNACLLGQVCYGLSAYSINYGLSFGCDTLLSQCYSGNRRKMGLTIQRAAMIGGFSNLVSSILFLNSIYLIQYMNISEQVYRLTQQYITIGIFIIPFDGLLVVIQKYIINLGSTWSILIINIIGNMFNLLFHYVFLYVFKFGIRSAPVSLALSYMSMIIMAFGYLKITKLYADSWQPITRNCLKEWLPYLKLAIPGVLILVREVICFEGSVFLSSSFGKDSLSAQGVSYYVYIINYLMAQAFSLGGNILIGQYLGSNEPQKAYNAKKAMYLGGCIVLFIITAILYSIFYWIPNLYNLDKTSAASLSRHLLLFAIAFCAFNFVQVTQCGVMKAIGKQYIIGVLVLINYIILTVPLAGLLVFYFKMKMYGYWIAIIIGIILEIIIVEIYIARINWQTQAQITQVRVNFNTEEPSKSPVDNETNEVNMLNAETDEGVTTDSIQPTQTLFDVIKFKLIIFMFLLSLLIVSIVFTVKH
ncbi:unnamed protein product [Didymodactylos carnosus]|uniref:Multidrug and toxin extrusion protein n=1 Tax=Didymodactylos carnosus TaxID=1234261 RepID=A0A8S2F617_9BILA|nr:unnamed protein product [Didymodactylos carnosus]CAF4168531.1 unnamed protein product [Didymodactylos carnosus]